MEPIEAWDKIFTHIASLPDGQEKDEQTEAIWIIIDNLEEILKEKNIYEKIKR